MGTEQPEHMTLEGQPGEEGAARAGEPLPTSERHQFELRRLRDERLHAEALAALRTELEELRANFVKVVLERDAAQRDAARWKLALEQAESSATSLRSALDNTNRTLAGLLQKRPETPPPPPSSAPSSAVKVIPAPHAAVEITTSAPIAEPAILPNPGKAEHAWSDSLERQLERLDRALATLSEKHRTVKNERFALREKLAALKSQNSDDKPGEPATESENPETLKARLHESLTESEALRAKFETLSSERERLASHIAATKGTPLTPDTAAVESQRDTDPKHPAKSKSEDEPDTEEKGPWLSNISSLFTGRKKRSN